jgi:Mycothiol maleylpyruvate isomerase N-terminal domain
MEATTVSSSVRTQLDHVGAFFETLLGLPSDAPTACAGWTAHELTAHIAAGAAEEADLVEAHLAGAGHGRTRDMNEREAPYRALPDHELRARLVEQGLRLTSLIERLALVSEVETVVFTGRPMNASDFGAHSKSECALHRWDLVGSDSVSMELLADPALTVHATHVLTEMPTLRESIGRRIAARAGGNASHRVVLRSLPADDVVVSSSPGGATTLALEPPTDEPATLDLHAADRLLVLWGRRPAGIVPGSLLDNASIRLLAGG